MSQRTEARERGKDFIRRLRIRRDKRAQRIRTLRADLFNQKAKNLLGNCQAHTWNYVVRQSAGTTPLFRPVIAVLYAEARAHLRFSKTQVPTMGTEYYSACGAEDAAYEARIYARIYARTLLDACAALKHGDCDTCDTCGSSGYITGVVDDEPCPTCTPDDGKIQAKDTAPALTDMERAMPVAIREDQYHDAHGALSPVWSWSPRDTFAETFSRSSAGGVMSSLVKKGLALVQGNDPDDTVELTKQGLLAIATHPTPELLLANGTIWVSDDHSEYVGNASDGTEVNLGYEFEKDATERYLVAHPTPDTW